MTAMTATAASTARRRATLIGAAAVPMWSMMGLLAALTTTLPPFQVIALAFGLAATLSVVVASAAGRKPLAAWRQPLPAWLLGVGGLFGYHFFYFMGVRFAPPVEANLINYLWPLLIVLFSGLPPGERLGWTHLAGAAAGFAGMALIVARGGLDASMAYLPGYLFAAGAAFTWGAYSVASRRFGDVPTDAVGGFCFATAILSALAHFAFEETTAMSLGGWLAVAAMGVAPLGASFFVWDYGCKHGDIRALGATAYAAPLLSTLLLIAAGLAVGDWTIWAACALIVGGALLASRDLWRRAPQAEG